MLANHKARFTPLAECQNSDMKQGSNLATHGKAFHSTAIPVRLLSNASHACIVTPSNTTKHALHPLVQYM